MSDMSIVRKIVSDVLEVEESELSIDASSDNVSAWDSIATVNIMTAISDEYEIDIDIDEITNFTALNLILELVTRLKK